VEERGISHFFRKIYGINDNLAHGKSGIIKKLFDDENIDPAKTLLIGDTLHDAEVAAESNIPGVLIARGHQSRTRLETTGNPVFDSLTDFHKHFLKRIKDNEN
jgi:phosphoglycolate phosphatase